MVRRRELIEATSDENVTCSAAIRGSHLRCASVELQQGGTACGWGQLSDLQFEDPHLQSLLEAVLAPVGVDDITPADIYGIEVYRGPATVPRELLSLDASTSCGLVMIWTRYRTRTAATPPSRRR